MSLTGEAAGELYGLAPDGFLDRRKELVAAARAAKDRDAAKAIGALRRPTVAAWLINLLQRDTGGGLAALSDLAALGVQLREAQAALAADRLRELGRDRRTRVADLVSRAEDLAGAAGHGVGPSVEREIEETLVAAVADEAAAAAVLSGTLTRALSYSGFGEVDLAAAVAVLPDTAPRREPTSAQVQQAIRALAAAQAALADAEDEAVRATRRRDAADAAAVAADRAVTDLQQQLAAAQQAGAAAGREQQQAREAAVETEHRRQAAAAVVEQRRQELARVD